MIKIPFRYPLEEFVRENETEDKRCLALVEEAIENQKKKKNPLAGIIVEPIQSEGGDFHGSNFWFQELQKICRKHDIVYLIDEVQTGGGATGSMWGHDHFDLPEGPDIVTFSKKMLTGGIYYKKEKIVPNLKPFRIFNTWCGDPGKIILLNAVLKTIQKENLLQLTKDTGKVLLDGLVSLQNKYPKYLNSARGLGTFCAIDCDSGTR